MFCVNLVTSSATSLRMKDVSGCEDSALGGRKAYVRRVPTGAFRWVDIVSDKCCEKKMVEALEGDCALHMLLRGARSSIGNARIQQQRFNKIRI